MTSDPWGRMGKPCRMPATLLAAKVAIPPLHVRTHTHHIVSRFTHHTHVPARVHLPSEDDSATLTAQDNVKPVTDLVIDVIITLNQLQTS
jgi:hypothetical protein